ncbi:putative manganese transporter [Vibrio lentus]
MDRLISFLPSSSAAKTTQFSLSFKRLLLPISLAALVAAPATRELTVTTLSDAFWAVSCYVALTLAIYHWLSLYINKDNVFNKLVHQSRSNQVVFAALMGALPGCGGAIVVTTQFISGKLGFGAVVAVLVSTMGDAAFLLIASEPKTGLAMMAMGVIVGTASGRIINLFHADDFLRPKQSEKNEVARSCSSQSQEEDKEAVSKKAINLQGYLWSVLIIPGAAVALLGSFQVDVNELLALPEMSMEWTGTILLISSMFLWGLTREIEDYKSAVSEDEKCVGSHPLQKTAQDTNFVTAWVVVAFLFFEFGSVIANVDFATLFSSWGIMLPLAGVLMGLLPGCGPQLLVTSLYLSGALPLSAQVGNAISNDGDALFPAIAMAPKAALVATLYSSVPALICAYGYWFMFEL